MFVHTSPTRKAFAATVMAAIVLLIIVTPSNALVQESSEWKRGRDLYESQNFVDALPLLEKAAVAMPEDPLVLSRLGFALYAVSITEKDPKARHQMLDRAREILKKSQALGDNSNLTQIALDALSRDGEIIPFSQIKSADAAIHEGEAAFVRGDLDAALKSYKRALELDPKLYDAALYAGDSEFKKAYLSKDPEFRKEHFGQAAIWFAKAVAIDENRETAHRYWGDALDVQGKTEEARDKFVEAIVAEPFNRKGYMGLTQWANRHRISMAHPKIVVPANVSSSKSGEINITLDEEALKGDKDGGAAWVMYGLTRAAWMNGKGGPSDRFSRVYPEERSYRHSLAEEVDALRMVAESVQTQLKEKQVKELNPSLANLIKLKDEGLLEAFVLFTRVDEGIARDYATYRSLNRAQLRRYWLGVVIQK